MGTAALLKQMASLSVSLMIDYSRAMTFELAVECIDELVDGGKLCPVMVEGPKSMYKLPHPL